MRYRFKIAIIVVITTFWLSLVANSAERPTIEERLIRLEDGQKRLAQRTEDVNSSLNKRIDDLRKEMNARFTELRQDTNARFTELRQDTNKGFERIDQRFEDMNQRIDDLQLWLQIIAGILVAVFAGLIAHLIWILKRLTKVEIRVEEHISETQKPLIVKR